ncbi:MAG: hybrid sensor histidine kinase/response regulator [Anaerolineaceae bacterium]|nr:hybrid sensor histidine kinase/response regulator [Anaerolineae bacterium]MCB9458987.1 hybrid sensor histidine kinase/response regulator [Anaerolineaceae bacterium]
MTDQLATILYIEDDLTFAYLFQYYLECAGYNVEIALTGSAGIAKISQTSYDIIAIAQNLFDYSGLDLMRTIVDRSDMSRELLPSMVMVAKRSDADIAVQAMKLGAVDYLIHTRDSNYEEQLVTTVNRIYKERRGWKAKFLEEKQRSDYMRQLESFSQVVAHDLKNPISIIMGFSDILKNGEYGITEQERQEYIELMHKSSVKMHDIVDSLLMLARTKQTTDIALKTLDMADIMQEAKQRTFNLVLEYNAIIEQPSSWPEAVGFAPWIEAIWVNYISNAIKYGGKPPVIKVGATELPDNMIRFWVKDNGPGLSPLQMKALFQPFKRLHGSEIQGTGLGLTIVQQIAEKLGGTVGVDSTEGAGSIFWFTLPTKAKPKWRSVSTGTTLEQQTRPLQDPSQIATAPLSPLPYAGAAGQ